MLMSLKTDAENMTRSVIDDGYILTATAEVWNVDALQDSLALARDSGHSTENPRNTVGRATGGVPSEEHPCSLQV